MYIIVTCMNNNLSYKQLHTQMQANPQIQNTQTLTCKHANTATSSTVLCEHWQNTLPLTQFTPGDHTANLSSGSILSGRAFSTGRDRSYISRCLNCVIVATQVPSAQVTSSGRGTSPARDDEDVIIILHQQQTMHVAHNIPNTIHTFSEGTQKGSLCTYSALCSITCCMNPQLGNSTCIWTGLGQTHTQEHTAQREVCVCVFPKEGSDGDRVHCHTLNVCAKKVLQ